MSIMLLNTPKWCLIPPAVSVVNIPLAKRWLEASTTKRDLPSSNVGSPGLAFVSESGPAMTFPAGLTKPLSHFQCGNAW